MAEIRKIKKELRDEAQRLEQKKQKVCDASLGGGVDRLTQMRREYEELLRFNEEEKARNSRELKQQVLLDIQAAKEYEQVAVYDRVKEC
eukprot:746681-Hanusia_phi.AAC.1